LSVELAIARPRTLLFHVAQLAPAFFVLFFFGLDEGLGAGLLQALSALFLARTPLGPFQGVLILLHQLGMTHHRSVQFLTVLKTDLPQNLGQDYENNQIWVFLLRSSLSLVQVYRSSWK
jgi:hypothetical protein